MHAFVEAQQLDISLTGIGLLAGLPFDTFEGELIQVSTHGAMGQPFQFDCIIKRIINKDGVEILGAEFIVDSSNYSNVVRFVYGAGSRMIFALTIGNLRKILSFAFLNTDGNPKDRGGSKG